MSEEDPAENRFCSEWLLSVSEMFSKAQRASGESNPIVMLTGETETRESSVQLRSVYSRRKWQQQPHEHIDRCAVGKLSGFSTLLTIRGYFF